jgi:hypothetical protein
MLRPFSFHILTELHHFPFKLNAQPSAQAPNQVKSPPHTTQHPRTPPNPPKPTSLHHACVSSSRVGFLKNDNGRGEVNKSLLHFANGCVILISLCPGSHQRFHFKLQRSGSLQMKELRRKSHQPTHKTCLTD